jgi:hypothetical protein
MKITMKIILGLFVVFIVSCLKTVHSGNDKKELVLTHILFRHGDRSPVAGYPSDPYKESEWPQGFGQLTTEGMNQQFELGKYLRHRYIEGQPYRLIDERYNRYQIEVRSTDFDRTLMSAYSNLAGFFPPNGSQMWNKDLDWQPIPVHTLPKHVDFLLNTDVKCPKYDEEVEKVYESEPIKQEERENKLFYEFIDNVTGTYHESIKNVWDIYDTVFCEHTHHLKLPEWVNSTWNGVSTFEKLRLLHELSFMIEFNEPILSRLRGGPLLGNVVDHMKEVSTGLWTEVKPKVFIYSAHDSTVAAFTSAMKVYNRISPPYASTVLVELLKSDDDQYFVEVLFKNDSSREPYQLTLPNCTFSCPLKQFIELTKGSIPVDWKAECRLTTVSVTLWFILAVVFMSLCGLLLITFASVTLIRRRRSLYAYRLLPVSS